MFVFPETSDRSAYRVNPKLQSLFMIPKKSQNWLKLTGVGVN